MALRCAPWSKAAMPPICRPPGRHGGVARVRMQGARGSRPCRRPKPLAPDWPRPARACGEVWNAMGADQTTITRRTCGSRIRMPESGSRPVANTQVWIASMSIAKSGPIGGAGENSGSAGRVSTWLSRPPDLTAERFVDAVPTTPGALLYRTGDRRVVQHGNLEHLGRLDFSEGPRLPHRARRDRGQPRQPSGRCPVRGHRPEDRPGDVRLVAYVVPRPGAAVAEEALREAPARDAADYHAAAACRCTAAIRCCPWQDQPRGAAHRICSPRDVVHTGARTDHRSVRSRPSWRTCLHCPVGVDDDSSRWVGHSLLAAAAHLARQPRAGCRACRWAVFDAPGDLGVVEALAPAPALVSHAAAAAGSRP